MLVFEGVYFYPDPIWRAYFSNYGIRFAGIITEASPFLRCCLAGKHVFCYNMVTLLMSPQIYRYGRAKIPLMYFPNGVHTVDG